MRCNFLNLLWVKKPRKLTFSSAVSILPSPVESRCVMFLYPMCNNHPDIAKAKAWCETNGLTQKKDSEVLQAWIQSALKTFSSYGTVVSNTSVLFFFFFVSHGLKILFVRNRHSFFNFFVEKELKNKMFPTKNNVFFSFLKRCRWNHSVCHFFEKSKFFFV